MSLVLAPGTPADQETAGPSRSTAAIRVFWARFRRNRLAVAGLVIIVAMILAALLAGLLVPYDPLAQDLEQVLAPESWSHLMGTDDLGRDQLSRIIYGTQISLEAALFPVAIGFLIGVPLGLSAGYYRGIWDEWVIMRIVDAMQAFPFLILALALAAVLGAGFTNAMLAIGIGFVPGFVRIVRAQVMSVAALEYVEAARAIGARDSRIVLRHIMPNALAPLLVQTTAAMASAILAEAALSFLGLGVQPPTPSWGQMLSVAQGYITTAPWLAYWPGTAIFLAVLAFNLVGDGVREALDPRMHL